MDNGTENQAVEKTGEEKYLSALTSFGNYYTALVCLAAGALAVAVAVSFFSSILWGIAVSIVAVSVYVCFSMDEAKKQLGLRYENTQGRIIIKRASRAFDGCLVIPSRLIFADVTEIADGAVRVAANELEKIYIPVSIERIGKDIFSKGTDGVTICYEGTQAQWKLIESATDFSGLDIVFECKHPSPAKKLKARKGDKK